MTLVAPLPTPGPRTSQSKGESAPALRNGGDVDFVAALAETVSQASEDGGGATAKVREMAGTPPRTVHRLGARDRRDMATVDTAEAGPRTDIRADVAANSDLASGHDDATRVVVEGASALQVPDTVTADNLAAVNTVPAPQDTTPRTDPARDALAVLGVGLPVKSDTAAAAAELTTPSRRQVAKRAEPVLGETGALGGPDLPGDIPDTISATPVRVVRQETHFKPVALEARRLLGMNAGAPDDRVLPLSLAAATKLTRLQGPLRESQEVPTVSDRLVEAAGPLAPAAVAGQEAPTLGSIGQQLVDGVQRALGSPAEMSTPRSVPTADPTAPPAYAPVLRSIKLQLNPVSLGVVTIVLTGSESEMRVHLEAERAETFGRVEQERGAISARLNGAGYAITELTVGRMGAADASGRDGDQREAGARQGGQTGAQQGDTAGGGARDGGAQFADQRAGRHSEERATRASGAAASIVKGPAGEQVVSGVSYAGRFRPV
jgi:Flagellar hook-length control protein FliK